MDKDPPPIRFTLKQLQYFAAVARTGQISLAAAESNVTQSTMTAAIAELERVLGTALFGRHRSGVSLTYQGHLFLHHARSVLDVAHDAARHPFQAPSNVSGTLQVAAGYMMLGYFLLPFVAKFQKMHAGVRLIPVERDRSQIEASVAAGELELAVVLMTNLQQPERFERQMLARSRRQLWVADAHPLADVAQATLEEIAAYPYVLPTVDEGDVAALRYWQQVGMTPVSWLRTSSMETVREMVALGMGVAILADMIFRPWSLDGRRIRAVPLAVPVPPMEVALIWRKDHPLSPVAEAFRDYLRMAANPSDAR